MPVTITSACAARSTLSAAVSEVATENPRDCKYSAYMSRSSADGSTSNTRTLGATQVEVRIGDALDLPVASESVDFVISNGVLNLAPDKQQAFSEVARILKTGGQFLYGDIVVANELAESIRRDIDLWTG